MDKKEYLLKVLAQLEPIRDLAKWLRVLVDEWNLWDDVLNALINAVQWAVNTAKSELDKQKLQKWLDALQKMKEMEEESKMQDEKDLEELDKMLENI
jgi:DNA-binding FrmR family transcriptional regulator